MDTSYLEVTFSERPNKPVYLDRCPLSAAMTVLDGKWKPPLIWWLGGGPKHFGELRRFLPYISQKVLSATLRDLTDAGIVTRAKRMDGRVQRVEYGLTDTGAELVPILDALCKWGVKRRQPSSRSSHA